ncbi:MAG: cellulase family glycosylhydrolase [Clostridia bacterium]|nr:cellulase family glycosylhydrolase [Clostridia bacterium]
MRKIERFSRGMGIGGWLTNYKRFKVLPEHKRMDITIGDLEHFESYITERDIRYIASLGLDHIRLGFDQIVIEETPYKYRACILKNLHDFVDWCEKYKVRPILNMHKAVGNYCDVVSKEGLLDNPELCNRFVAVWDMLEDEFAGDNEVMFELLNEVVDRDSLKWNPLAKRTIDTIRKKNKERYIIVGCGHWGSPPGLDTLDTYDDDYVIYTFHTYNPFEFTHQRGLLQEGPLYYNREMPWPCDDMERYRLCYELNGNLHEFDDNYWGATKLDIDFIRKAFEPAVRFIERHPDKILWCGEFGTIRHARMEWRQNWMRDVITVIKENDMPYSVWNYLSTPNDGNRFSLVDDDRREILSAEMHAIILGNV